MRTARRNAITILLGLLLTGCGSDAADSTTSPPGETRGSIRGTVRNGQVGVPGANLALSGGGVSRSVATVSAGTYSFTDLAAGTYTVSITAPAGFQLAAGEAGTKTTTVAAGQQAVVDFTLEAPPPSGNLVTISVSGLTFSPAAVTIARGTTVRWVNNGSEFHTVTPDGHSAWNDTNLPGGGTFQHTFSTAGTYRYYCTPHRGAGMTGTINVQ